MSCQVNYEVAVKAHYRALYQFAYSLTHSVADAADLTQQTFYVGLQKAAWLREPRQIKAWLFTTLHRLFLTMRRKQLCFPHVQIEAEGMDLSADTPAPDGNSVDYPVVLDALKTLQPIYQTPLTLFYLQDYSYIRIAHLLSVPVGTVQSRLARGKARLRGLLADGQVRGSHRPQLSRGHLAARRRPFARGRARP